MSILAEPRRKQRISVDPQNVNWHRNQDKFGQKMLEKMGWQEGKGLGRNEQGITQNIALKANHTAKGKLPLSWEQRFAYDQFSCLPNLCCLQDSAAS